MDNTQTMALTRATLLSAVYPIGAIFMSTNSTNPENIFGGKWEAFAQGRTIIGCGQSQENEQSFVNGETGGSCTHTLTIAEMPNHTHEQLAHSHGASRKDFYFWFNQFQHSSKNQPNRPFRNHGCFNQNENTNVSMNQRDYMNDTDAIGSGSNWGHRQVDVSWNITPEIHSQVAQNNSTGEGHPHSILPPYIVTYIWRRIG